jgi:predicted phage terminase large subunit-like protein
MTQTPTLLPTRSTDLRRTATRDLALAEAHLARQTLLEFTAYTFEKYDVNWHHRLVADALDQVLERKIKRLMVFQPPQTGKSELVSRRFPAYALGKNPDLRIIACSYSDSLAQDMSRDVQRIMGTSQFARLFPGSRLAEARDEEKRTQKQFDVVGGFGYYIAVGIMGSITGKTSDIGIVDDPIKNRAEAESEVYRDRVYEQYTSSFATRQFGAHGAIVLCMTRWHEDDLAGRLLKLAAENPDAEQWTVIDLPAIAEVTDAYRTVGDALWPSKYSLSELAKRRAGLGSYDWAALYQQHPAPRGGGLFKAEWFADKLVDAAPVLARRARGWDTAGTEGDGDWTVGVKIAELGGIFYIEDVQRKQLGPSGVDSLIRLTAELDGIACVQREEKEGGSAGAAVIAARTKTLAGRDYAGVQITGSKITRSKPFRAQCEAGNVRLVRGAWNYEYIKELADFPTGTHDDQVDGSSCAFNAVLLEPPPFDYVKQGMTSEVSW